MGVVVMSKAAFYVCPWSVAHAMQEQYRADLAQRPDDRPWWPMFCHHSVASHDAMEKDPSILTLGHVHWAQYGPNAWELREQFERTPGVISLGEPWESVPAAAIPVLETRRQIIAP